MSTHEIDFAQHVPVIECGVANIKLGVFTLLSKKYRQVFGPDEAVPLAYCVARRIFCDPIFQSTLEAFEVTNSKHVSAELHKAMSDPEIREAASLVYAVRIIQLGWHTHSPLNANAMKLVDMASEHGIAIPDLLQIWGPDAIVRFFLYAKDFVARIFPI